MTTTSTVVKRHATVTTVAPHCGSAPAAATWPTRQALAQLLHDLPMGVPAGSMRVDMGDWYAVLDAHLETIRRSGARKIGEIVTSTGMYVTLLAKTGPNGFVTWLRNQDRDPSRLFIGTADSCPDVHLTSG